MSTWTLSNGTVAKSLSSWGITNPRLALRNQAVDEFTFRIPKANVLATPDFLYGQTLSLYLDGVQKFRGMVTRAFAQGSSEEEADEYVVSGPWWHLENTIYQQQRVLATVVGGIVTGFSRSFGSQITLGQDPFGNKISVGAQIRNINTYALSQGIPYVQGLAPDFVIAPLDVCRDITCAEAIKRCLMWEPQSSVWFNYTTGIPTLNIATRGSMSGVTVNLTAGNAIVTWKANQRRDLVPRGVVFNYATTVEATQTIGLEEVTSTLDQYRVDSAGLTSGLGVIVQTIEMSRDASGGYESPPVGLATAYYNLLAQIPYEGTLRLKGVESPQSPKMGNVLNFSNGRTMWSNMDALIQTASYNLTSGTVDLDFGPPEHLSPQDFVQLHMTNRKSAVPPPKSPFSQVQPDGTEANPDEHTNPAAGGVANPFVTTKNIPVCVDGILINRQVYGP